jgi:RND family efflux transporter MFP subunit
MRSIDKKNRTLGIYLSFMLLLTACTPAPEAAQPTPFPTPVVAVKPVYTVQRGDVSRVMDSRGRAAPVRQVDLSFRVDGIVREVLVSRGDQVRQGEVLARLEEPERLTAEVTAAELRLFQAQQNLETLIEQAPIQTAEAFLALVEAENALDEARRQRTRLDYTGSADALLLESARMELTAAEQDYQEALNGYNNLSHLPEDNPRRAEALQRLIHSRTRRSRAQATLDAYTAGANPRDIALAEAKLNLAEARYDQALKRWKELEAGVSPFEIEMAEAAAAEAETRLSIAHRNMEYNELKAPFDGEILVVGISSGSQAVAFRTVMTIADPTELEIAFIPGREDVQNLGVGQSVSIYLNSRPDEAFNGVIRRLPSSILTQAAASDNDDQTARVVFSGEAIPLTAGEIVRVAVQLELQEGVLWLPPQALRSFQGFDFVLIQDGEVQRRIDVSLGLKGDDRVEIRSGLEEGQIVLAP